LRELEVHRELSRLQHQNILPLVDWGQNGEDDLMLMFPLYRRGSLRDEINRRVLGMASANRRKDALKTPWKTKELKDIFTGICRGVSALQDHSPAWAHRDVKPENVLMTDSGIPQLMDFGSVTTAEVKIRSRKEALMLQDQAAEHSTMPYRAPELFEVASSCDIDGRTDVWSLGCLLFAMVWGYSPFECEFEPRTNTVRVVECGYLRVIGKIPSPPEGMRFREDKAIRGIVEQILQVNPRERLTLAELLVVMESGDVNHRADEFADFSNFSKETESFLGNGSPV
jgi:serine/threonine kinase 16